MWYRAKCIKECIFRGVRRRPGSIYEGPVKPPRHFEIIEEREDGAASVAQRNVCPFCGNEIPAAEIGPPLVPRAPEDDPGKKFHQLKAMNKTELVAYGEQIGFSLDMALTKDEMIERIQDREAELENEGVN
jgi:hypothetical protein